MRTAFDSARLSLQNGGAPCRANVRADKEPNRRWNRRRAALPADFDARRVAGAKTAAPRPQTCPTRPDAGGVSRRPRVRLPVLSPRLLPRGPWGRPGIYTCRFAPRADHAGVRVEALRGHRDGPGRARGTLRPRNSRVKIASPLSEEGRDLTFRLDDGPVFHFLYNAWVPGRPCLLQWRSRLVGSKS